MRESEFAISGPCTGRSNIFEWRSEGVKQIGTIMPDSRAVAALNNALWCDAVLSANSRPTRFHPDFWINEGEGLPLYPNLVTLVSEPSPELIKTTSALAPGTAVKDSFAALNLGSSGFQKLLTGTWLHRPPRASAGATASPMVTLVESAEDLEEWVESWADDALLGRSNFQSSLLENEEIGFLAVRTDGAITGGAAFNMGPHPTVGITNLFGPGQGLTTLASVVEFHTNVPIVGYEVDESIVTIYEQLGFSRIGPLDIWLKR